MSSDLTLKRVLLWLIITLSASSVFAETVVLFDGTNTEKWVSVGDGLWTITSEGYLLGQRDPRKPHRPEPWFNSLKKKLNRSWFETDFKVLMKQAWLYTKEEFSKYDLSLEWWLPTPGNSGISIGDKTRARYTFGDESDLSLTPSQIAYEIQLNNQWPDDFTTGSMYSIQKATSGYQKDGQWNSLRIETRPDLVKVFLNGQLVMEHEGVLDRSKEGPIGLQLHDESSLVMFRNIVLTTY